MEERFEKQIKKEDLSTELLHLGYLKMDLLDGRLDFNILDKKHRTPLSHACEEGYKDLLKQLLNAGATLIADQDNYVLFT